MQSTVRPNATLVDLLDRVLDRGLVINADIIISLAGVPLIGINLRAALAGMDTMVKYGVMREWDEAIRAREQEG
ncbi:MAG: gas vesicle protein [Chloroflexi bacterium]|nr:gas vesicle protein [Chloroflexota bacterium]